MSLGAITVAPRDALDALEREIDALKGDDKLSPVVVIVPTNAGGVMARRALGRRGGVVGVDMLTLNRLAELIAGPRLAAQARSPMSAPVLDLVVASVLADQPGDFAAVADHPSTVVAFRELHTELRLAAPSAIAALAEGSRRGAEAARVSAEVQARLRASWYDEADLYDAATAAVADRAPAGLGPIVLHLPQQLAGRPLEFVRALAAHIDVRVIADRTGVGSADREVDAMLDALGIAASGDAATAEITVRPRRIISTTDADDEVRIATREVVDAARAGTPLERMAILWPSHQPYARLVEHHLTVAEIPWNGRPGTTLAERLVCRFVLDLLDLDRRGLRRRDLFALLADVPARDHEGSFVPTAAWERASREAGVAGDADWRRKLEPYHAHERLGADARSLSRFVDDLRRELGHPEERRRWWDWAQWCGSQLDQWIGRPTLERLPEPEYRAWEALTGALDRLRHLDPVGEPVTRRGFRSTLAAEIDATLPRYGRVGDGVSVGPLGGAVGFDVDLVVLLGAAEGSLPPTPRSDPLLSDAARARIGLPTSDARADRLHRRLLQVCDTTDVVVTVPRGDLRSTASRPASRWLPAGTEGVAARIVESHVSGLATTAFPATASEYRLRTRYGHVHAGGSLVETAAAGGDEVLERALRLVAARSSDVLTEFDGDLSSAAVPPLDAAVSPSRLESWVACPHAYFMHYLLGVEPIEEPDDEITITALERGSLHHEALDRFHRAVLAGELPQPNRDGWGDDHLDALLGFLDEVCAGAERRGRTGRPAYWADEGSRMRADLTGWLQHDSETSTSRGATIIASELPFGGVRRGEVVADPLHAEIQLPDGRALAMRGVIDRVDRLADGSIVVTDHKTGKNRYGKLSADDPTMGATVLQLPSYAAAARSFVGDPTATVLAEYGMLGAGRYARVGYELTDDVWSRVAAALGWVVDGIESGYYPNRPERPGYQHYVQCEYCQPDHLGTAQRWAEWERKRHDPRIARWFAPDDIDDGTDHSEAVAAADAPRSSGRSDGGGQR